jgi:hypothetical protein
MNEQEMQTLLLKLTDMGITGINVYYEGSGDDGSIEFIVYSTEPNLDFEDIMDIDGWDVRNHLEVELYKSLDDFVNETILNDIEDWYNNDGGYGYVCIKIPSGEYKIFNSIRITEIESYEHEGDLINKSLQ